MRGTSDASSHTHGRAEDVLTSRVPGTLVVPDVLGVCAPLVYTAYPAVSYQCEYRAGIPVQSCTRARGLASKDDTLASCNAQSRARKQAADNNGASDPYVQATYAGASAPSSAPLLVHSQRLRCAPTHEV